MANTLRTFRIFIVCIALVTFLAGCGDQKSPPQSSAPKVVTGKIDQPQPPGDATATAETKEPQPQDSQTTVAALEPSDQKPEPATSEKLGYDPEGKIDPFEPLFKEKPEPAPEAQQAKKTPRRPRTPLEMVDISQLKLVAIISAESGNRAMVQDASGKGFILKEGTYIGLNSGTVTEILGDRVMVEEEIEDVLGNVTIRSREIKLPKPPGEE